MSLRFDLVVTTSQLWMGAYSKKQQDLFKLIVSLKEEGLGYRRIAKLLNSQGIRTPRDKEWSAPHVYSVIKKGKIRIERLNATPTLEAKNFRIEVEE